MFIIFIKIYHLRELKLKWCSSILLGLSIQKESPNKQTRTVFDYYASNRTQIDTFVTVTVNNIVCYVYPYGQNYDNYLCTRQNTVPNKSAYLV